MKKFILIINGNQYEMGENMREAVLSTAKEATAGKWAIYAVQREGFIEAKKEVYQDKRTLMDHVREYMLKGFKVYYNRHL